MSRETRGETGERRNKRVTSYRFAFALPCHAMQCGLSFPCPKLYVGWLYWT